MIRGFFWENFVFETMSNFWPTTSFVTSFCSIFWFAANYESRQHDWLSFVENNKQLLTSNINISLNLQRKDYNYQILSSQSVPKSPSLFDSGGKIFAPKGFINLQIFYNFWSLERKVSYRRSPIAKVGLLNVKIRDADIIKRI